MCFKLCLWLSVFICSMTLNASPLKPEHVPEPLKPWINWVLQDVPDIGCPFMYNSYEQKRCSWPTQLFLNLNTDRGSFTITWKVYQESWVSLPGDQKHWPVSVTVNTKAAPVMARNGIPAVKLPAGDYAIKGDFSWQAIPENLTIPSDTGLINVQINGQVLPVPNIKEGQLWLTENDVGKKKPENIQNNLDVQVFRYLNDDVPMKVTTRLVLNVSGEQREIRLPKPILSEFIPLSLQSPLPARLEPDGQLLVQVRPGQWQIDINARSHNVIQRIALETINADWPASELWVFEAHPDLRVVDINNISTIDASQTNLPDEWKHLPAYKVSQGQTLDFKSVRSGDPEPEPNQLNLNRKLWLNFNGDGYTVNDVITGTMTRDWRINALPKTQLGKVMLDGNNQLITLQAESGKQGVEVRKGTLSLNADSRILGNISTISAVGWEQSFHNVSAELNLPPGWRLFAASGVDNVPDSWVSRWNLMDFFLVLIATLVVKKLFTLGWSLFALITFALIWHEPEAPKYVWLFILGATALVKVLPEGKFLKLIEGGRQLCGIVLILVSVPFMMLQVRTGIYPQLEEFSQNFSSTSNLNGVRYTPGLSPSVMQNTVQQESVAVADMAMAKSVPMPAIEDTQSNAIECQSLAPELQNDCKNRAIDKMSERTLRKDSYYDVSTISTSTQFERIDPKAKVQTGPGLPQWQWHPVMLSWNGSVDANQQLRLWYLSPVMTLCLNISRVVLISILALLLFGQLTRFKVKVDPRRVLPILLCFIVFPILLSTQSAHAELPSKDVLNDLRTRLLEAPDCLPSCAQMPSMKVAISDKELLINLQIHAQQSVAIPLPVNYEQWFPNQVIVDGTVAQGLYRDNNNLWINLPAGSHNVVLRGMPPVLNSFTLPFILKPNQVDINHSDWNVTGVQDNGQIENQLQFTRLTKAIENTTTPLSAINLPAFVKIERTLQLGLDWRVTTQIHRVSPVNTGIVLTVPLLAGESVTTPGINVDKGYVAVNMAAQQTDMIWESTLAKTDTLSLLAPQTEQWIEVWRADVSPIWHLETSGIAMMHLQNKNQWLPEWHPWPGEKIILNITRPQSVEGQTLTIDNSDMQVIPGIRSQDTTLRFTVKSSQGTQHTLMLPEYAALQSVTINGQTHPLRQEGRKLTLPINPGEQVLQIIWQTPITIKTLLTTPQIDLGRDSVNTNLHVTMPENRWILVVFGPKLGPAVLFWGQLMVLLLLAFGLGKVKLTPLKGYHWFLLLIGLSQIPLESAGIVIVWLMLLGWRSKKNTVQSPYFNGVQTIIVFLTVLSLGVLLFAVGQGLLGAAPNMQITGNNSSAASLNWYQDRSLSRLPIATIISVPLMVYRILMFVWSFWLAMSLLKWLQWGWQCFSYNGLWYKKTPNDTPLTFDDPPK